MTLKNLNDDIKNQRFPIALGTAIVVLIFVVNISFWLGIAKTNTDRDIKDLQKVTEAIITDNTTTKMRVKLLEENDNKNAIFFKELEMTLKELHEHVKKLNK